MRNMRGRPSKAGRRVAPGTRVGKADVQDSLGARSDLDPIRAAGSSKYTSAEAAPR